MIIKHLYQRTVTKKGKKIKAWYFWFYDENHKQVRRSCGQNGQYCTVKREAEAYLANLNDDDLISPPINQNYIRLADFCSGMFDVGSTYLLKCKNKGIVFTESTRKQKVHYLKLILERFGEFNASELNIGIIDDWLLRQERSNSWRNNVLAIFRIIFDELYIYKIISEIPLIKEYKRIDQEEKGILYPNEILSLFPADEKELIKVWKIWDKEEDYQDYIFATLIYTLLSTGLRNGEVRALVYSQFIRNDALLINAMFNASNQRVPYLKKATQNNKKWRIAILPEKTISMIKRIKEIEPPKDNDFIFTYHGTPFSGEYINYHFKDVLEKHGINTKERNISIHSLRYTFNTMMNREIDEKDLRLMIGHVSQKMTDYYDKSTPLDHLSGLLENKSILDNIWK